MPEVISRKAPESLADHPAWYSALTLGERRRVLSGREQSPVTDEERQLVERRLARWRKAAPFDQEAALERRLSAEQVTLDGFTRVLGTKAEELRALVGELPDWLSALQESATRDDDLPPMPEPPSGRQASHVLAAVEPLIRRALAEVRDRVDHLVSREPGLPFDGERAARMLLDPLAISLLSMVSRTFVLELNVARMQGVLPGASPEERFARFCERLKDPAVAGALFCEYPVLARQVVLAIWQWRDFAVEFFERLATDWTPIRESFFLGRDPGPLESA
ncbi:MAG: hypothetical protein HY698_15990, partial [Deltaproteobacteria bacterium]|nr:hypothetical protein [Deltaproteobacteria bacterium]